MLLLISSRNLRFFQSVALVPDVRHPVYWCVAYRSINYDTALSMMADVQWDLKDLASQHSAYVDHLLKVCFFLRFLFQNQSNKLINF